MQLYVSETAGEWETQHINTSNEIPGSGGNVTQGEGLRGERKRDEKEVYLGRNGGGKRKKKKAPDRRSPCQTPHKRCDFLIRKPVEQTNAPRGYTEEKINPPLPSINIPASFTLFFRLFFVGGGLRRIGLDSR